MIGPHLSSREFFENEVTMLLALLAFNIATILRNEFEDAFGGRRDVGRPVVTRAASRSAPVAPRVGNMLSV